MFPAAREKDPVMHDGVTPAGIIGPPTAGPSPTPVLIEGQPAAHVTCTVPCSGATAAAPLHPPTPTPVLLPFGLPTVHVNGFPACRSAPAPDLTACGAFLGDAKLKAARTTLLGVPALGVQVVQRGNVFLVIDPAARVIVMLGMEEYFGNGATQAFVDKAVRIINRTWSGPTTVNGQNYTVYSLISGRVGTEKESATPGLNHVRVAQTSTPTKVLDETDPAYQSPYGRKPGYMHSNEDDDGRVGIAHEFGHTMGLPDEYVEGPPNPDGTRNVTFTGPRDGLMGYTNPWAKPTPQNFSDLINGTNLLP
jgi:hypothetical protein